MKKVLFTATVDSHILNFHLPYLKYFKDIGYEVHVASNGNSDIPNVDIKHNIPFERSPYKLSNIVAYKALKKIVDHNSFEIIHCNTPMGSVLTRLAARHTRKNGTKVIYTAHGFHFFKGAPVINWLLYYPIEKWLAKYTDCLITINEEDYQFAKKNHFKVGALERVNGVGVDRNRFHSVSLEEQTRLRRSYGYDVTDFIVFYAAELSFRKNQEMLINTVNELSDKLPNLKLLLAGTGPLDCNYRKLVNKYGLESKIQILGYRKDIKELLTLCDIVASCSRQEGLPVNIMEAMASGKPAVVTDVRGNRDLIKDGENGFVIPLGDVKAMSQKIEKLALDEQLRKEMSSNSLKIVADFTLDSIFNDMTCIYKSESAFVAEIER